MPKQPKSDRGVDSPDAALPSVDLSSVLGAISDLVFIFDSEGRFVFCNRPAEDPGLLYDPAEFLGKHHSEVLPEELNDLFAAHMRIVRAGQPTSYDYSVGLADGTHWYTASLSPLMLPDGRCGAVAISHDITARKRSEADRDGAEARWRALFENTPDTIMLLDHDLHITDINHTVPDLTREQVIGASVFDYVPESDRPAMRKAYEQSMSTGEPDTYETHYVDRDGTVHIFEGCIGPIKHEDQVVALAVSCRNITDRVRMEQELRESEERFKSLFEQSSDAVFVVDPHDMQIIECNPAAVAVFGYTSEEMKTLTVSDLESTEDPCGVRSHADEILRKGEDAFETVMRTKTGERRNCEVHVKLVTLGGTAYILGLIHDITDLRRLERTFVGASERERREIGYSLHDDIGQHLSGVLLMCEALRNRLGTMDPTATEQIERITTLTGEAVQKIRALVRGMSLVVDSDNSLADALEGLAGRMSSELMRVHFTSSGEARMVNEDTASHLYRIAQEALTNAVRHAGATTITMSLTCTPTGTVLSVADNGNGSSHADSRDAGMGIKIMQFRSNMIGGSLSVRSQHDSGTTVTCTCPNLPPPRNLPVKP